MKKLVIISLVFLMVFAIQFISAQEFGYNYLETPTTTIINATSTTGGNVTHLENLTDVTITDPENDEVLTYDSGSWINKAISSIIGFTSDWFSWVGSDIEFNEDKLNSTIDNYVTTNGLGGNSSWNESYANGVYLKLNQQEPQKIINGVPTFIEGLNSSGVILINKTDASGLKIAGDGIDGNYQLALGVTKLGDGNKGSYTQSSIDGKPLDYYTYLGSNVGTRLYHLNEGTNLALYNNESAGNFGKFTIGNTYALGYIYLQSNHVADGTTLPIIFGIDTFEVVRMNATGLYENNSRVCTESNGICLFENSTWNEARANGLYVAVGNLSIYDGLINNASYLSTFNITYDNMLSEWNGNKSLVYNHTIDVFNLYNSTWDQSNLGIYAYNHTIDVFNLYNSTWDQSYLNKWNYNQTEAGDIRFVNIDGDNMTGNLNVTGNVTASDFIIPAMNGNNHYETLNDAFNLFNSAGRLTGGALTNPSGTNIVVEEGEGVLRIADDDISQVKFIHWDASSSISVPTNSILYFGVEYNDGSPQVVSKADYTDFDLDTDFPLGSAINQADEIYILNNPWWVGDGLTNVIERFQAEGWLKRDENMGGLILGYTGTRNPTLSAGTIWSRLTEFNIPEFDSSSGDKFDYYYRDAGGNYVEFSDQTQWNITSWDDGSGTLQPLDNNRYAVIWVWVNVALQEISLIYPQAEYPNSASAEAEEVPEFPSTWYRGGILVGRIIIKEGVDEPVEVQSAFTQTFTSAEASDHGNLAGLTDDDHLQYILKNGSRELTGNWSAGNFEISAQWFRGLFNWTTLTSWLSFDGAVLEFNETQVNYTIRDFTINLTQWAYNQTEALNYTLQTFNTYNSTWDQSNWGYNMTDTIYFYNMTDTKYYYNQTDTIYFYNMTDPRHLINDTKVYFSVLGIGTNNPSHPLHIYTEEDEVATFESTDGFMKIILKDSGSYNAISSNNGKISLENGVPILTLAGATNSFYGGVNISNGGLISYGATSFTWGTANAGTLKSTSSSSISFGYVGTGNISSTGVSSLAGGYVNNAGSTIEASGQGSIAWGRGLTGGDLYSMNRGSVAFGDSASSGSINSTGIGSFAIGSAGAGFILSEGIGSFASGRAESGGFVNANGTGAVAQGFSSAGDILASGSGAIAIGFSGSGTKIQSTAVGSIAIGQAQTGGGIFSKQNGAIAMGRVADGYIISDGIGTIAMGYSAGGNFINSTGDGSIALGRAFSGNTISNSTGSIAFGDSVVAGADNSITFGRGVTNNNADSFLVGWDSPYIHVNSTGLNSYQDIYGYDDLYVADVIRQGGCPTGFTRTGLGCIQTAEEGSDTIVNAIEDCYDTYGGRLPTSQELTTAINNLALTDETDDSEWVDELTTSPSVVCSILVAGTGTDYDDLSAVACSGSYAYRCFVDFAGGS